MLKCGDTKKTGNEKLKQTLKLRNTCYCVTTYKNIMKVNCDMLRGTKRSSCDEGYCRNERKWMRGNENNFFYPKGTTERNE